jgi:aminopeptidase N
VTRRRKSLLLALALIVVALVAGLFYLRYRFLTVLGDSGGALRPLQAAYDVRRYELEISILPETRSIAGRGTAIVVATSELDRFEIHLEDRLEVSEVTVDGRRASHQHAAGLVTVALDEEWSAGERHAVEIVYAGEPREARRPPWDDGLVWSETPSGAPWLGVTAQGDGADLWWPAKDHPSDEPDEGLAMTLTVPSGLVGLSNGRKLGESANNDGTVTTRWEVSYPINNYDVTFNAAPYVPVETVYRGVDGTLEMPIVFWAIPEHVEQARKLWLEERQGARILEVLGRRFGEYPFLADKFWVAEAPYLGMEHQTLVAYGARFENNPYGFDWLLLHEMAHEWWGNQVTARDWADFWIHEGFGVYAEALFVDDTLGEERYLDYVRDLRKRVRNRTPIVQGRDLTSGEAYTGDIYGKGALVLHTLRWMIGDEAFLEALRRFATDPRFPAERTDSAEFERLVAELHGRETPWFWQRYLRTAAVPRHSLQRTPAADGGESVTLSWDDPTFELALPVAIDGDVRRIEMPDGRATLNVAAGAEIEIDPEGRVLAEAGEAPRS